MMAAPARVEPMNATSSHAKVKTALRFANQSVVSGEFVAGKLEIECKTDKGLGIGIIMVELLAFEELLSRDHSAAQTFLHSKRVFQGPGLPPSNAVHPYPNASDPPLPQDYFPARRGTTSFLFRIRLPDSSPPSTNFGSGIARIRYEVRATVGVVYKGEKQIVMTKQEVNVLERYDPRSSSTRPESVVISENGRIWVKGEIVGEGVFAGQPACVALTVKNHSAKKNTGLTVALTRRLVLPNVPQDHPLQIMDTLTTVPFRGAEYIVLPGMEGIAHLIFDVPDAASTVKAERRHGGEDENRISPNLFSIQCIVNIKMSMAFGNKDIQLELPVTVYHSSVLPLATELARVKTPSQEPVFERQAYQLPVSPAPYMYSSPSPPQPYSLPMTPPPVIPFVDNGRVYLPSSSPGPYQYPYYSPYSPFPPTHHISPARPSSAEPTPSSPYYTTPSGMPTSSVPQPLPTISSDTAQSAHREEGKGERASRITHHLRMSSRTRSVSPQSHRYAISYAGAGPPLDDFVTESHSAQILSLSPLTESPNMQSLSPDVISPRPMHSPKHTVTVDPFTHATFNKSERVEVLERAAAEAIEANADMSGSLSDLAMNADKTLPKPPVPSSKTKPFRNEGPPRANMLFPPSRDAQYPDVTPPTPTLNAFSPPKASRPNLGTLGGLDALEAKLLEQVGTRKAAQEKRADVRTIMPITIPRPGTVSDPVVDSAISSLSLPGIGADEPEGTLRLDQGSYTGAPSEVSNPAKVAIIESKDPQPASDALEPPKERPRKKSTPKPRSEDVKEKEQHRLRKAARGRVAAWLGSIDPDIPPQTTTPPPESPTREKEFKQSGDSEVQQIHEEPLPAPVDVALVEDHSTIKVKTNNAVEPPQDDEPNPRSSGFIPLDSVRSNRQQAQQTNTPFDEVPLSMSRKEKIKLENIFLSQPQDPEVRYDIRSARGGRGGIVTAVGQIWASTAQPTGQTPSVPLPPPQKQSISPLASRSVASSPNPAVVHLRRAGPPTSSSCEPAAVKPNRTTDISTRHAKMIKSTSVPAIISSSLATPMLSSTASLAKPPPTNNKVQVKPNLPPVLSSGRSGLESKPATKPKPSGGQTQLAFGQARIRELIKKYQG